MGSSNPRQSIPCQAILLWDPTTQSGVDCLQTPTRPRKLMSGKWTHLCEECDEWASRAGLLAPWRPSRARA